MKRRLEIARGPAARSRRSSFSTSRHWDFDPQAEISFWNNVKHLNETENTTVFLDHPPQDEADRGRSSDRHLDHGLVNRPGTSLI